MTVVLVAGALANRPGNAGGAWVRHGWVAGLRRLGLDAYFVEQIDPAACVDHEGAPAAFADSVNLAWFRSVTERFGIADHAALVCTGGEACAGVSWPRLLELASAADLLINLGGHLTLKPLVDRIRRRTYVDLDPGYTQLWHADPSTPFTVAGHDFYFTVGLNVGSADCPIPTGGVRWRPVRPPVVLADWPVVAAEDPRRFTTVASWRGAFGPVQLGDRTFGPKAHEFRKLLGLPSRVRGAAFEIALDIHPGDARDLAALREHGWRVADPRAVAGDPAAFRRYVQESGAEFSAAQAVYVETNSGWFSDRTVRYLAAGKPVLVQDTGFGRHLPTGRGLVPFRTVDEAVAGAEAILGDYDRHCRAARALAEEYFDSDVVLGRLLKEVGVAP